MKTDIETINFAISPSLETLIQNKLQKLSTFYQPIVGAEVYLKKENNKPNKDKAIRIKINIPGPDVVAEFQSHSFELSLQEVFERIEAQLKKKNEIRARKR